MTTASSVDKALADKHIHFIGGGNMAASIFGGLIEQGFNPQQISVKELNSERAQALEAQYGLKASSDLTAEHADVVLLAVKPQVMDSVLTELSNQVRSDALVLSVAAGVTIKQIKSHLGEGPCIVRTMPNTPALIGWGATALFGEALEDTQKTLAQAIMESVGIALWVNEEQALDTVTAISGSGPAYYFLIMEAMIDSAQALGLDKTLAHALVTQTAAGAAMLAKTEFDKGADTPAQLRQKVTSPGGTTQAAINHMIDSGLPKIISDAVEKAKLRSIELGEG